MAIKILENDVGLNQAHLDFFLRGNLSLEKSARHKPHAWFPDNGWQDLMRLITLGGNDNSPLAALADSIERDEELWRDFYELAAPETAALPDGYSEKLSALEQLLVLRCVRMDRITVRYSLQRFCTLY